MGAIEGNVHLCTLLVGAYIDKNFVEKNLTISSKSHQNGNKRNKTLIICK